MSEGGYFPRGASMLRHVQEQRAVGLLYGQRALGIGALAPLNFIGTRDHTRELDRPFKRLVRTALGFETIFFGSKAEADRVLRRVRAMHEHVNGTIHEDAGPFTEGTPYSALDPELMLWTIAVAAESAETIYELLIRRLSREERDALWRDWVRFGELFGMPREVAPPTRDEFREWYDARLAADTALLTDDARETGYAVMFQIPVPPVDRPAMRVHNLILRGSLPSRVRELYGLRWTPAHAAAFHTVVAGVRAGRPLAPRYARTGENSAFFELVRRTEEARLARGEVIPGALA